MHIPVLNSLYKYNPLLKVAIEFFDNFTQLFRTVVLDLNTCLFSCVVD